MKPHFIIVIALSLLAPVPALAGGVTVQRVSQEESARASPYLPGSPVWSSPYMAGPVLGGVFYDGPSDETVGLRVFSPARGVSCSLRRHACWTPAGVDRAWTARFFGLKS